MKENPKQNQTTILILDNIRSTHNVGAIFRTADAINISEIFLVGITPCPIDRFGRPRQDIAKSALGAEKNITWHHFDNQTILDKILQMKKEQFKIVAIEQSGKSIDYKKISKTNKMVFIVGNEVCGLSADILNLCDVVAEIPMRGQKESLNVSVATGIALFRILD
jgi:23S rRNA (guanosine2251-2'-O)-methyltransferase